MRKTRRINKRRKYSLRKRKSRRINMKGGRGLVNTCREIKLLNHSFTDLTNSENLRLFTFGTTLQKNAWLELLEACNTKNIPVYILTSGNKIGIIVTLQLMGLQGFFEDVLCVSRDTSVNPYNKLRPDYHDFHGKTKYEVIQQIMTEKGISCVGERRGFFLDDVIDHSTDSDVCPSIEFKDVINPSGKPPDFNLTQIRENPFYELSVEKLGLDPISEEEGDYNFTPFTIIGEINTEVTAGRVNILFLDFDKTFQMWSGAIPFQSHDTETNIQKKGLTYRSRS
jgi:hypothetical protein